MEFIGNPVRAIADVPSGGHLILTVPADQALWSRHDIDFGHYRRYDADNFSALWRTAPVEQRLLSPFNARLRPVIAGIRRLAPNAGNNLRISSGPMSRVLHHVFAGEAPALVRGIDRGVAPFRRGVSLAAVLRKQ